LRLLFYCAFFITFFFFFFFFISSSTVFYTLSLHDALPISVSPLRARQRCRIVLRSKVILGALYAAERERLGRRSHLEPASSSERSEEHTSELQSRENLVCRLLLEKKKEIN